MFRNRFSSTIIIGSLLAIFIGVALYFRIALPYHSVFSGDWIKFTGIDAYYHMRLVDNMLHHFPHSIAFDPYTFYPHGSIVSWPPLFDWLLAGSILLADWILPIDNIKDLVGVYFPAILGALIIIPVYFIGRTMFNRWVGVSAAALIAVLPGEFLGRSLLGFTDHHIAEVLFTTLTILFLALSLKHARKEKHHRCLKS